MPKSFQVPFVRSAYNYDANQASTDSGLSCMDETLAQQHFREECDINYIVNTFLRTGVVPSVPLVESFGDFSGVTDFHSALNTVLAAQESFMKLDPSLRNRFGNDPAQLIDFVADPANRPEAIRLGLVRGSDLSTPRPEGGPHSPEGGRGVGKSVKEPNSPSEASVVLPGGD